MSHAVVVRSCTCAVRSPNGVPCAVWWEVSIVVSQPAPSYKLINHVVDAVCRAVVVISCPCCVERGGVCHADCPEGQVNSCGVSQTPCS